MVKVKRKSGGSATKLVKPAIVPQKPAPKPEPTVESLLDKAQTLVAQCSYELALAFLKRILEKDSSHVEARELLGLTLLETSDLDMATRVFKSLIPPSPTAPNPPSSAAYLYLAQLADDPQSALQHYKNGLDILNSQLKGKGKAVDDSEKELEEETKRTAVRTVISMVEIWMTDLCFEPQAETECETLLSLALDIDPENPEALQSLASVRISQQRPEDAVTLAGQSWSRWKDLSPDDSALPPISSRLTLTRLFIELEQYIPALTILQDIVAADEQEVEAWYLQGWCLDLMATAMKEGKSVEGAGEQTWEELKQDARNCLETCKELHVSSNHPDAQILEHVNELIGELEQGGFHATVDGGNDDEEEWKGIDGDADWVDESDSDGDVEMS